MHASFLKAGWQSIRRRISYQAYWRTFDVVPALDNSMKKRVFALRYEVYCLENRFLDAEKYPDGLEMDRFDERALHFLLIHRESGADIGTARLILPDHRRPLISFELQRVCDDPLLQLGSRMMGMAELSRFCMKSAFRRRAADGYLLPSYHSPDAADRENRARTLPFLRRHVPYAPLGLLAASFKAALDGGAHGCLTALEPKHLPCLRALGLEVCGLGPPVELHGLQQPCLIDLRALAGLSSPVLSA